MEDSLRGDNSNESMKQSMYIYIYIRSSTETELEYEKRDFLCKVSTRSALISRASIKLHWLYVSSKIKRNQR